MPKKDKRKSLHIPRLIELWPFAETFILKTIAEYVIAIS